MAGAELAGWSLSVRPPACHLGAMASTHLGLDSCGEDENCVLMVCSTVGTEGPGQIVTIVSVHRTPWLDKQPPQRTRYGTSSKKEKEKGGGSPKQKLDRTEGFVDLTGFRQIRHREAAVP